MGLAALFVGWWALRRIIYSPFGAMLTGIRENAARMRLIGNRVLPHLTLAYVISAAVAGMAGALFTQANAFVGLGVLAVDTSIDVLVMLVLGGIGGLHGAQPQIWALGVKEVWKVATPLRRRSIAQASSEAMACFE